MIGDGPETIVIMGRSGCGKGTQSQLLLELLAKAPGARPTLYIQTGTLFREFVSQAANPSAERAKKLMDAGARFPDFLAIWNWSRLLIEQFTGQEHLLFDGAPRSLLEAQALATAFSFYERPRVTIIHLKVSHDWAVARLRGRGRADDLEEKDIEARLRWFETEVTPAIDFFRSHPEYRFVEVLGEQTVPEIHQAIANAL